MIFIDILQYSLFTLIGFLLGYQVFLGLLAFRARRVTNLEAETRRKFAIIVPAHNEEKMISKTIYSLFGLVYPKKLYDLIVVADNCSDKTARIARNLGATVMERRDEKKRGKGYALRWAMDQLLTSDNDYDALIVVDSDSLVSGNYLEVMNHYLESGSEVIQSSDLVLPRPDTWSIETTRIGFLLYNHVKPLGRKVLGFNMGLRGNGMCFSTDLVRRIPWQSWALTEDLEYGLILMLQGVKIDFAPEAHVWAQMPVNASNAESQRTRWEFGRFEMVRKYATGFLKKAWEQKSIKYLDVLIDLITPPFVNVMLLVTLFTGLNLLLWSLGLLPVHFALMWAGLAVLGGIHLFTGLYVSGADKDLYKSLLYIPMYVFWKVKVYLKVFISGREMTWIRTTRDS